MSSLAFWLVAAAIGIAEAAIVIAALRMRIASDPARGILGARATEVLWTLLPVLLVLTLVLVSFQARQESGQDETEPALAHEAAGASAD